MNQDILVNAEVKLLLEHFCNFKTIDSTNYPYFTGMSIADNGVKKLKLELFDPNFASYTKGITTDNSTENVISLEALIRGAIRNPVFFQDETIFKYESDGEGKMQNDYLAIVYQFIHF